MPSSLKRKLVDNEDKIESQLAYHDFIYLLSASGVTIDLELPESEVVVTDESGFLASTSALTYDQLDLTDSIVNSDIKSDANVQYSKLNLNESIVNDDIHDDAQILHSKLNLTDSITNSHVNSSAGIDYSKLDLSDSISTLVHKLLTQN